MGVKKLCRPNQYFGVRAAQESVKRREGGIIWHTQGSGKSLTMVWLTKWIREHVQDARVLVITDLHVAAPGEKRQVEPLLAANVLLATAETGPSWRNRRGKGDGEGARTSAAAS